jgi:hypothetical protein
VTLARLKALFARTGCTQLYAKRLAENDNSKNQVYFGPDFKALNLFPNDGVAPSERPGNSTFKAKLRFGWLLANGGVAGAPHAQLILYPQYPEVRFSGFLRGCTEAPSKLMASRQRGRVLFLGVNPQNEIVGFAAAAGSQEASGLDVEKGISHVGLFLKLTLPGSVDETTARSRLLAALRRINNLGWIDSKQLGQNGVLTPCNAPQCGGFTLEAELGIPKNSAAEPDYLGWEIKQHAVSNFDRPASGAPITLMTPEPNGGIYRAKGPEAFVREFGYLDKRGRPDRMNFGGVHKIGKRHASTGLTLRLQGYDVSKDEITDKYGTVELVNDQGRVAASWAFAGLLAHWSQKHSKAAYVPSRRRDEPARQYAYGRKVRLAEETDPLRLLRAFAHGSVFYDPGIKLENFSSSPKVKPRSQFRIASRQIHQLYESVALVDVVVDG